MRYCIIFKQLKQLGELNEVLNEIGKHADDVDFITNAIKGLSKENAIAAISTTKLSDAQKLAALRGFELSEAELNAALATKSLGASQVVTTKTTSGLSLAMKGLWATLKPFLKIAIVAGVLTFVANKINDVIHAADIQAEKNEELRSSYQDLTTDLDEVVSRMETIDSRIKELDSAGPLSLTDQQELENLKQENKELEYRKTLLEGEKEKASTELNTGIESWWDKEFNDRNYTYATIDPETGRYKDTVTGSDYGDQDHLTQEKQFKLRIERAKELIALGEKRTIQDEEELRLIREATTATANELATKIEGYEAVTEEQKAQKALWESYIADAAYVKNPAKYQAQKFDEVWNSNDFRYQKTALIDAVNEDGVLDPQVILSNEEYKKLLDETGISADALAKHIGNLVAQMRQQATTTQDFQTQFENLPIDLIEDYIAIANADGFSAENISDFAELDEILKSTGLSADKVNETIKEIAESSKHVSSVELTNQIQESYNAIDAVRKEYEETKDISLDCLSTIAAQYPELNSSVTKFTQGLITADEFLVLLEQAYQNDVDAYRKGMVEKLQADGMFWNNVVDNNQDFFTDLAEAYKQDIENYKDLATTKAMIDAALIKKLAVGWGQYYKVAFDAAGKAVGVDFAGDESADLVTNAQHNEYIQTAVNALGDYNEVVDELNRIAEEAIVIPDFNQNINNDDSSSGSGSDANKIDWIERKNQLLQEEHDWNKRIADDESKSYNQRISALNELIAADETRAQIARDSANKYNEAWNEASADLRPADIARIMDGSLEITEYDPNVYGEEYVNNLNEAMDLWDKKTEYERQAEEIEEDSLEHQRTELALQEEIIANQQEILQTKMDMLEAEISLAETTGRYVGAGYYKDMIAYSEDMTDSYEDQIRNLQKQLKLVDDDSAEHYRLLGQIEDCEAAIMDCTIQQAEWNETIERLPIERIRTYITLLQHTIEDLDNFTSQQSQMGKSPTKDQYQTYIDLYTEEIAELLKEQEKLVEMQKKYDYGSEKYKEYADEIQGIDNEIAGLINKQLEYNDAILQIPVTEMQKQYDNLAGVREAFDREIAEDNAKGLKTTIDQYQQLNGLTVQQLQLLAAQREVLVGLLSVYDKDSDKYKEVQEQIAGVDSTMSSLVTEQYQWNQEILNMPVEKLGEANENLSSYSSILGEVLGDYDSALEGINALIDGEIEGYQKQLDLMEEENKARKVQLGLEQALYNLHRAEEQKNVQVIREGRIEYESNADDLRSAREDHQDALLEKQKYDIEQQIESLESIKEKWQEIIDKIQEAKSLQAAEDLFGTGWKDSVLADSEDLRNIFQSLYESTSAEKEAVDKQIASNERLSAMMNEFITRYTEGSLTYEQALTNISGLIASMEGGFTAFEQLNGMMDLDNIASLGEIASSASAGIAGSAELLKDYLTIVESNKASVEGFETVWSDMATNIDETVEAFYAAADSMEEYLETFTANANAIDKNTSTWEEMKENIEAQVEALRQAAKALEEQANSSSGGKKPSSSNSSDDEDDEDGGTYYGMESGKYHESEGTTAEIYGKYGTDEEKKNYREYRENLINAKADKSGDEGWRQAALAQLDEELAKAGIPKYHTGAKKGPVKGMSSSYSKLFQSIAIDPLKSDEIFAKLQAGEWVVTPAQVDNIISKYQTLGEMAAASMTKVPVNNVTTVNFNGGITMNEVQDVEEFTTNLFGYAEPLLSQKFSKVF